MILNTGDKIELLPVEELFKVLQMRNFCFDDETRQKVADEIGGSQGIVQSIEQKYQFDYFFYLKDGDITNYSIPYQVVLSKIE